MALFTDGPVSTIEDLSAQDSQILDVAGVEGIDLSCKLALAQEAAAIDLEAALGRGTRMAVGPFGCGPGMAGPYRLENIVVTPALRLWNTYRTLEMAYGDAYFSQLNDRYAKKRDEFGRLGRWAYERLILTGIGIAPRPVAQAATPDVEPTAGTVPDGTYYVTMAWANAAGEEGASAIAASITTAASGFAVTPKPGREAYPTWNLYAGTAPETMTRQNTQPVAAGTPWIQTSALTTGGNAPGRGQAPSYYHVLPHVLQRG
jgi:hypothetical protein